MFIEGFGIAGYRSFGELQEIGPFKKVNFFIGQNNVGKSNILRFVNQELKKIQDACVSGGPFPQFSLPSADQPRARLPYNKISFVIDTEGPVFNKTIGKLGDADLLKSLLQHGATDGKCFWYSYTSSPADHAHQNLELAQESWAEYETSTTFSHRNRSFQVIDSLREITGTNSGGLSKVLDVFLKKYLRQTAINVPIIQVPDFRDVSNNGRIDDWFGSSSSSMTFVKGLQALQNPADESDRVSLEKFKNIRKLLRDVLGRQDAEILVSHDASNIQVSFGKELEGDRFSLSNLGAGVRELIIIATAATLKGNCIITLEEPELHLHPTLQKHLVNYLIESTENQYFITTHSLGLVDLENTATFHVSLKDRKSKVQRVETNQHKLAIFNDLGYRASDLLQANFIIWVEGPSDRIYLNRWINIAAPDLKESVHFTIMFYGGKLLSHLSADDQEIKDFIDLRKINQHLAILMDSDCEDQGARENESINTTKKRVKEEFESTSSLAWVTAGREVENYIDATIYKDAIMKVHPSYIPVTTREETNFTQRWKCEKDNKADKVKVAHYLVNSGLINTLDGLDLKQRIESLVSRIKKANGLE